jgi:hypothetical protein
VILFGIVYFLHQYFNHYPYEWSQEWQYGYKESIAYVNSVEDQYDEIRVTKNLGRPYIYYLFFNKTDPHEFRKTMKVSRDPFGFVKVLSFGKYSFPEDFTYKSESSKKVLYINTVFDLPKSAKVIKTFHLLNGTPALVAYE